MPIGEQTCIYLKPNLLLLYFIRLENKSLVFLDWSSKGVTPVFVLDLLATVVVVAYVAKCFYKKVVITNYYLLFNCD